MLKRNSCFGLICAVLAMGICSAAQALPLGGLIQDLNADIGVATTGSNVNSWANQGIGGDNVTTASGSPQLITNAINGHNAISFTSDRMNGSNTSAFDANVQGNGYTWFAVVDPDNNGGVKNQIFGTLTNSNPFSGQTAGVGSGGGVANSAYNMTRPAGSDVFAHGATGDLQNAGFVILAGRLSDGTGSQLQEVFVNSPVADGSSNVNILATSQADAIAIGAERTGGSEFFDGDIARLLIWDRPLTDDELNQAGAELARIYGLDTQFTATIPEPVTTLFAISAAGLLGVRRRRQHAA